jgi:hypothetical protein
MCGIGSELLEAVAVFVMRDPTVPVREVHFDVLIHGAIVARHWSGRYRYSGHRVVDEFPS